MKQRKPGSKEQHRPAPDTGMGKQERLDNSQLEVDALRAMLGLPDNPTPGPLDPDTTEAPTD